MPYLLITLAGLLMFPGMTAAQVDTLAVVGTAGAPGSHGHVVRITLTNVEEIAGLQLTLTHAPEALVIDSVRITPRTAGMTPHWNQSNGKIILIDFSAQHKIEVGYGSVIEVVCSVKSTAAPGAVVLNINDVVLSDPFGKAIPVTPVRGVFSVEQAM